MMNKRQIYLRKEIIKLAYNSKLSHIPSALSAIDIMDVVYNNIMNSKDKFILSKGHACLALYILLREKGFNPIISGHPDIDVENGIECTTGSLGHGLPMAVGMALGKKLKNESGNIYALLGDGECQEGTTWESFLLSRQLGLDNLIVIIDYNKFQALGTVDSILSLNNLFDKLCSFGCFVKQVDGHDITSLYNILCGKSIDGLTKAVIANTIKGKGISFMENVYGWHSRGLTEDTYRKAMEDLK